MTSSMPLRVVFMGTPEFAVSSLDAIRQSAHQLVGVVTAPDRPAGRGRKLQLSAVKTYCIDNDVPVMQPENLSDPAFVKKLQSLRADVFVVVAFKLLPKEIFSIPRFGTFNCHASILPDYRGAAPINWAIINGEPQTGVTTFFIDEKVDTGAILEKAETDILANDNAGSLHDKLQVLGSELVVITLDKIANQTAVSKPQNTPESIHRAPKLNPENRKIDWASPGIDIVNLIRGLSPYPCAWTQYSFEDVLSTIKIAEAVFETATHQLAIGELQCDKSNAKVAVRDGFVFLKKLQFQGKKMLNTSDLLNGSALQTGAFLG